MSKAISQQLPQFDDVNNYTWKDWFRRLAQLLERKSYEGTAAPTQDTWNKGTFFWNTDITELGTAGNKYVILGWICSVSGTPGTWLQCRVLTGN